MRLGETGRERERERETRIRFKPLTTMKLDSTGYATGSGSQVQCDSEAGAGAASRSLPLPVVVDSDRTTGSDADSEIRIIPSRHGGTDLEKTQSRIAFESRNSESIGLAAPEYRKFARDLGDTFTGSDDVKRVAAICSAVGRLHGGGALRAWLDASLPPSVDKNGLTPLMLAIKMKRKFCVRYLVEEGGASINVQAGKQQTTAAILASYYGQPEVLRLLAEAGADLSLRNRFVLLLPSNSCR